MKPDNPSSRTSAPTRGAHIARYLLIGFFTVAPLWVTWLVFEFLLAILAGMGTPLLHAAAGLLRPLSETLSSWLLDSALQQLIAILLTLGALYAIGVLTTLVLGRRLLAWLETLLERLPLVQTIYGGTKRFLASLRDPPARGQRVVLISFPSPEMKAVGFLTRVMQDADTGRELAAVYVPTSPNPTSGYIEIVPLSEVVYTDWTMEEAMSFVMTGGTNAPEQVSYSSSSGKGGN
ncbi:MAG: DUF502 domain-containing protein [Sideroxydans sp.]|nr:DUF502 domain-containing protein [Sideroxydans sp.]